MKRMSWLSTLFSFVLLMLLQTTVTSCAKENPIGGGQDREGISTQVLTANNWKLLELRGVTGNEITFYERGGSANTEDFDDEYISFNADGTGTYYDANRSTHQMTWSFLNNEHTMLTFTISNPAPLEPQTTIYDNIRYKNKQLSFDQYWTYNGINSHAQAVRISEDRESK